MFPSEESAISKVLVCQRNLARGTERRLSVPSAVTLWHCDTALPVLTQCPPAKEHRELSSHGCLTSPGAFSSHCCPGKPLALEEGASEEEMSPSVPSPWVGARLLGEHRCTGTEDHLPLGCKGSCSSFSSPSQTYFGRRSSAVQSKRL